VKEAANNIAPPSTAEMASVNNALGVAGSLRLHWPQYLMEAGEMSLFMFCTCSIATLVQHPSSPVRYFLVSEIARRALMGLAIGATVIALIMSPWGEQSGGHINPAMTFAFCRLGKIAPWDALLYAVAQFLGAMTGVAIAIYVQQGPTRNEAVRYVVTAPGVYGYTAAFAGELVISFLLMTTVLFVTNHKTLANYSAYFVGVLYATFITFESPLSGMSMNPARTFGPAFHASYWHGIWIYFVAPALGMLIAAEVFLRSRGGVPPYCAKLYHANGKRCIFRHKHLTIVRQTLLTSWRQENEKRENYYSNCCRRIGRGVVRVSARASGRQSTCERSHAYCPGIFTNPDP
jgi:aquaporin Z